MKLTGKLFIISSLSLLMTTSCSNDNSSNPPQVAQGVYEGIDGYGISDISDNKDNFTFRFNIDGTDKSYMLPNNNGTYILQNRLQEGERVELIFNEDGSSIQNLQIINPIAEGYVTNISESAITVEDKEFNIAADVKFYKIDKNAGGSETKSIPTIQIGDQVKLYGNPVKYIDQTFVSSISESPVKPTPGVRTIKNLLKTALSACGSALYVYGGGWNWQDSGSSRQSCTIGVPEEWVDFFMMNDKTYQYKNTNKAESYYPWHAYNEYYYAGADCSGFLGWVVYNVMNTESNHDGFVTSSAKFGHNLSVNHSFGTMTKDIKREEFRPGDIMSINGHVWMCVGKAADGSLVIIHSTVNEGKGSGIQLSALNDNPNCKALELVRHYMNTYYPIWSERYQPVCKDYETYTTFTKDTAGKFFWSIDESGLTDPDGYLQMTAEEILQDLFYNNH